MKGCNVPRRFGWDCHGLPIESIIQSELNLAGVDEINKFGIDKFNEACRGGGKRGGVIDGVYQAFVCTPELGCPHGSATQG